jgi:hypothetical protein
MDMKLHMGLFGSSSAFSTVTNKATAYDIFPSALTSIRAGDDVINAQFLLWKGFPAILAGVVVPGKYVGPGKTNLGFWDTVIGNKHNYPGNLDQFINQANCFIFMLNRDL